MYDAYRAKLIAEGCDSNEVTATDERKNELRRLGKLGLLTLADGQHNDLDTYCVKEMMETVIKWLKTNCGGFDNCSVENRNVRTIKKTKTKRAEMVL